MHLQRAAAGLIACLITFTASAQTSVGGVIDKDTVWTSAGSPYHLEDHIYVSAGAQLVIEPRVDVIVGEYGIHVGTSAADAGHLTVYGARLRGSRWILQLNQGIAEVTNTVLSVSEAGASQEHAVFVYRGEATFTRCGIFHDSGIVNGGIYVGDTYGSPTATVTDCIIDTDLAAVSVDDSHSADRAVVVALRGCRFPPGPGLDVDHQGDGAVDARLCYWANDINVVGQVDISSALHSGSFRPTTFDGFVGVAELLDLLAAWGPWPGAE